ncbi:MAG: HAD family hydrolase [Chloroflexota bacterium]|nr:HAD family hydrolase [Chloroflexota bacterium]
MKSETEQGVNSTPAAPASSARAVLFDLDGTLVDSFPGIAGTVDAVLAQLGRPDCDRAVLRGMIGAPLEAIFRTLLSGAPLAAGHVALEAAVAPAPTGDAAPDASALIQRSVVAYLEAYPALGVPNAPPFPGVLSLLDRCVAHGLQLAVVTTKRTAIARLVLSAIGAEDRFQAVIGFDAAAHPKPHPAPALAALERLGTLAKDAVVVGDTIMDMGMARAAGCRAIGVGWGYQDGAALLVAGAEAVVSSPEDLAKRLLPDR